MAINQNSCIYQAYVDELNLCLTQDKKISLSEHCLINSNIIVFINQEQQKACFVTHEGKLISVQRDLSIQANTDVIRLREQFDLVHYSDNIYAIKSWLGKLLTRNDKGLLEFSTQNIEEAIKLSFKGIYSPLDQSFVDESNQLLTSTKIKNFILGNYLRNKNYFKFIELDPKISQQIRNLYIQHYEKKLNSQSLFIPEKPSDFKIKIYLGDTGNINKFILDCQKSTNNIIRYIINSEIFNFEKINPSDANKIGRKRGTLMGRLVRMNEFLFMPFLHSFPDIKGSITFLLGDKSYPEKNLQTKCLSFCTWEHSDFLLCMPDIKFIQTMGYSDFRQKTEEKWLDWEQRQARAFWRGASTGSFLTQDNWQNNHRIKLCKLAENLGNKLLDAKITKIVQVENQLVKEEIQSSGLVAPVVPNIDFIQYKYLIDIDGNSNSWPGLFTKLLMGSCVLKVESSWRQWYYDRLEPWVNYVPVKNDLSDLHEKINWCLENDEQAKQIGENGRQLALSMTLETELEKAHQTMLKILEQS